MNFSKWWRDTKKLKISAVNALGTFAWRNALFTCMGWGGCSTLDQHPMSCPYLNLVWRPWFRSQAEDCSWEILRSVRWCLEPQGAWKECRRKGNCSWEGKGQRGTVKYSLEFKCCSLLLTLLQCLMCQVTVLGFSNRGLCIALCSRRICSLALFPPRK